MKLMLWFHVACGALGLLAGFLALFAAKGARTHRRSGLVFVYAMLGMTTLGTIIAAGWDIAAALNVPAGVVTAYLVVTALTTVKPLVRWQQPLHSSALAVALAVGVVSFGFGGQAIANGGMRQGMPAFPFFMFGSFALLGAIGDVRVMRRGPLTGTARLARHLWRMCVALFVAAMSFFIGQADVFPEAWRIYPLLALPPLGVIASMLYWLWRLRIRRTLRGMVTVNSAEPARVHP